MSANTIITSIVTGGTNSHATVSEEANAIATDFITQGVVGSFTLNTGSGGTGSFCVNADATPDMGVTVKAGQAYISATPSSQDAQVLRARAAADYTSYTINANSSGSTKYDWIYLSVDATKANNPAADASDVTSIVTSRSTSNSTDNGSPPTYGLLLAIVTVANGASSITDSNITDSRVSASISNLTTGAVSGWVNPSQQWTYSSYDSTNKTGVITVPSDATTLYSAGMRVKFSNNGATQYGIITKVTTTTLTVYFGTDYSLTNSAITSNYYSFQKAPFGFPLDPAKWTQSITDTTDRSTTSSTYVSSGVTLSVPIGVWTLRASANVQVLRNSTTTVEGFYALSNSATSADDAAMILHVAVVGATGSLQNIVGFYKEKTVNLSSATTYYLIYHNVSSTIYLQGSTGGSTVITATSAYL